MHGCGQWDVTGNNWAGVPEESFQEADWAGSNPVPFFAHQTFRHNEQLPQEHEGKYVIVKVAKVPAGSACLWWHHRSNMALDHLPQICNEN